jgi:hypothetical protein
VHLSRGDYGAKEEGKKIADRYRNDPLLRLELENELEWQARWESNDKGAQQQ